MLDAEVGESTATWLQRLLEKGIAGVLAGPDRTKAEAYVDAARSASEEWRRTQAMIPAALD